VSRVDEMRDVIARWEQSGETQRAFAESEGVSYPTFVYWRRRLKELVVREREKRAEPELVPVRVVPDLAAGAGFEVRTASGLTLHVPAGFDDGELRRLMAVLAEC